MDVSVSNQLTFTWEDNSDNEQEFLIGAYRVPANTTRFVLTNLTNGFGGSWSVQATVDLVAHRIGQRWGEGIPESVEDSGDPLAFILPINDDFDEYLDGGGADNSDLRRKAALWELPKSTC